MELKQKRYELHGHILVFTYNDAGVGMITLDCMDLLVDMAKNAPKRGEWIISYTDDYGIKKTECSACGESFITYDVYGWKYCPWCGALMGERDGE